MSFRMDVYQRDNAALNNLKFQAESEQGAWLTENCWRFGIIFRFPTADFPKGWEDKSYKTGVSAPVEPLPLCGQGAFRRHARAEPVPGGIH